MVLNGKHIVLGISGSIAAYKACELIRLMVKQGAEVQVVITPAGKEFITPLTLATLSQHPVISEFFAQRDGTWNSHVDLGLWADAMVVAPATASTIGKMANGIADNMLITTYLAMKAPVIVAPAMDRDMYSHPSTQHNLEILRSFGNILVDSPEGFLASKLIGKGRMEDPQNILNTLKQVLGKDDRISGRKVLVTAGPTFEKIDPVRFIGNYSSGKMGYALAGELAVRGAQVTLVTGPVSLPVPHFSNIEVSKVESAQEMFDVCQEKFPQMSAAILCAAVADFTPDCKADQKIKREKGSQTLSLNPTQDIAASLGRQKQPGQKLVGFALETNDEQKNAKHKLEKKNLDFIVLNSLRDKGAGFQTDTNKITILTATGQQQYPLKTKAEAAKDIIDFLCKDFE